MSTILLPNGDRTNFTLAELACKHCGQFNYHPGFMEKLQTVRVKYGKSMSPTSGCRCTVHNKNENGHPTSSHISDQFHYSAKGQKGAFGVDIAVTDSHERGVLHNIFWNEGFSVGHNYTRNFIHADMRIWFGLPQIMFPY